MSGHDRLVSTFFILSIWQGTLKSSLCPIPFVGYTESIPSTGHSCHERYFISLSFRLGEHALDVTGAVQDANYIDSVVGRAIEDEMILDIGPDTAAVFADIIKEAGTIIWNGPVGVFEIDQFGEGTRALSEAIAASKAFSIAGGGDTLAAVDKYGIADKVSYISTGGGAFLEYVEGKTLPAVAILEAMRAHGEAGLVFPSAKRGKPLSDMSLSAVLRRMGHEDVTVHGFRSTFRDWTAEQTAYPRDVAEQALAHVLSDKVEAAYRRGDLFDKRRKLMDAWGGYCETAPAGAVVPIRRGGGPGAQA